MPISHICETKETPINPSATSWVGSTGSFSSSHEERAAALQTALARVKDRKENKMRVLFGSCGLKAFISALVVDKLALKPLREESLRIKAFGQSKLEIKKKGSSL